MLTARSEWLTTWVRGNSYHFLNEEECVPDYSCCVPELQAELIARQCFRLAYLRHDYHTVFLFLKKFTNALKKYNEEHKGGPKI